MSDQQGKLYEQSSSPACVGHIPGWTPPRLCEFPHKIGSWRPIVDVDQTDL